MGQHAVGDSGQRRHRRPGGACTASRLDDGTTSASKSAAGPCAAISTEQLLNEATYPRIDTVLAIAGRDDRTGEMIIKTLNTGDAPTSITVNLANSRNVASSARVITLQSAGPADENSFDEPRKIVPVETTRSGTGPTFSHELPPYSLTIVRIRGT